MTSDLSMTTIITGLFSLLILMLCIVKYNDRKKKSKNTYKKIKKDDIPKDVVIESISAFKPISKTIVESQKKIPPGKTREPEQNLHPIPSPWEKVVSILQ